MPSIDERVVSVAFENAAFEQRVSVTMSTLSKLNTAITNTGQKSGLSHIETDAAKVTLAAPMSALDRLKAKLGRTNSGTTFTDMENASSKVTLAQPNRALDNLKNKLGSTNSGTTFTDMENSANRVNLSGLTNALDGIKGHLTGLQTAAAVAFGNIASQAAMKGGAFAKSFAFGPIKQGFQEYQTNLKAIQTVQANTDQPLTNVNKSLQELNTYSDQTIYNFGEMAKNVGTFTAAGVDLKTSVSSIKGIANMAALSGSSSQQAATAMYQLSQAISSGRVGLQDWNSVVNAGMGGKKLQNALAQTGIAMGDLGKHSVKLEGPMKKLTINGQSFRESIEKKPGAKPWLSSDILVNTLATLDGRFSKAAMSAELTKDGLKKYTAAQIEAKVADNRASLEKKNGVKYTDAQFKALMHLSDSAFKSATEVKTLGQVFDIAKETIGSGWSASFQSIFGNLGEAKKTFTALSGTINGFINANALARNKVLHDWKAMGGRTELITGIKQAFENVMLILKPIKQAFRDIFPAQTGKSLFEFTKSFSKLMQDLRPSPALINTIHSVFAALFAVFHTGFAIVKGVAGVIFDLLGIVGHGSGGVMAFARSFSDFIVGIDAALTKGGLLNGFFKGLTGILRVPIELVKGLASAFVGLFGGFDGSKADDVGKKLDGMRGALTPLENLVNRVKNVWKQFSGVLDQFKTIVDPWFQQVKTTFSHFGDVIADGIKNANFDKVLLAFQTTFLGGIFLTLKKALGGGKKLDVTGGLLGSVKETLGAVTGQLTAMQKNVQAKTLLEIAGAVVILAGGIYILSTIEPKKLASSLSAIAVGLGELGGAMKIMEGGKLALVGMPIVAASMLILAGAVVILAGAMKIMATMSWEEIGKGLAGVGGSLAAVGLGLKLINPISIIPIALGLLIVSGALVIMATAMKIFGEMKWEELAKGLLGLGGAMAILAAGLLFMGPSVLLAGPGLIAAAIGMTILAGAVAAFGKMKLGDLVKGILGAGAAVAVLGLAMAFIPPTIGVQAAGLILLGIGLAALGGAVAIFGNMDISTLVKGIMAIGAALVVLGIGLVFMAGTLPGSLALLAAAAGLAVLVPSIALLGAMSWGTILKGLAAMALSLGVIAVVGLVAAPALLALGGALAVLGLGLILIGTAVYIAAKGLALLGENGAKGIGVLVSAITAFIAVFPSLVINFVKGLVSIVGEVAKVAPKVVTALGTILTTVFAFIIAQAPKLALAVTALITALLNVLAANAQPLITAGWKLLQNLLTGVQNNIGSIVTKVGTIITTFLNAFATQAPRIIQAGTRVIVSFLNGLAASLPQIVAAAARVVGSFLTGITQQIPSVVAKGARLVVTFLNQITKHVPEFASAGARLIVAVINGIGNTDLKIIRAGVHVIKKLINGIAEAIPELANAGARAVIKFLNGLAAAIRNNDEKLTAAGLNLASAIVEGMVTGMAGLKNAVINAAKKLASHLPHWVKKVLGIKSPSTVFIKIGALTMEGFAKGISDGEKTTLGSMDTAAKNVVKTAKDTLANVPKMVEGLIDMDPVISPVLDLGQVEQEARKLADLTNVVPITAAASFGQAQAISQEQQAQAATAADQPKSDGVVFSFEQHNSSPESLSSIEIYRQTNNLLSSAKSAIESSV